MQKKKRKKNLKTQLLKQFFYSRQFPALHEYSENVKQHQFSNFWSPKSSWLAVRKTIFKEHGQKPNHYDSSEFAEVQVDLLKKPFKGNGKENNKKIKI